MHTSAIFSTETLSWLLVPARASNLTLERTGSDDLRTGKLYPVILLGTAYLEVTVTGADADLTRLKKTCALFNSQNMQARKDPNVTQDLPVTSLFSNLLFRKRSRSNVEVDTRSDLDVLVLLGGLAEDTGSGGDIRSSRVGARNEVGLVDGDILSLEVLQGRGDLDRVGTSDNGRKCRQVEVELLGVLGVGISLQSVLLQLVDALVVDTVLGGTTEHGVGGGLASVPGDEHLVDREDTGESTPFSSHVADSQAVVNREAFTASKLDGVVQHLVVSEKTAEGNNNILSGDTRGENSSESDLGDGRNLPPGLTSSPDGSGVCANDGSS
ncbi:hypothetical protein HG531_010836 [Fusarium graminearum]|nr:hypothetical protein HG531_010836 [Fusarium graminearum]